MLCLLLEGRLLVPVLLSCGAGLPLFVQHFVDSGASGSWTVLFGGGATCFGFEEFLAGFWVIQVVTQIL